MIGKTKHILTFCIIILMVFLMGLHSSISIVQARSEWEIRAEAQFEFTKFVEKLQNEIELKDPKIFVDYKKLIIQLLPEFKRAIDRLDPSVKMEFCKLASTSSLFPVDCGLLDQPLPLPTSQSSPIGNASDPCSALQKDNYLTELEINTLQIQCNDKKISNVTNVTNSDKQRQEELFNETGTARAKERLNVGCDALLLLSNKTQSMLKNMNKDSASCYSNWSKGN